MQGQLTQFRGLHSSALHMHYEENQTDFPVTSKLSLNNETVGHPPHHPHDPPRTYLLFFSNLRFA